MDEGTRRTYLKRISYLENELKELEYKNKCLNDILYDLNDNIKIAIRFIEDRIVESSHSKDSVINKHLVVSMFKALHKILDECGEDYDE